MVKLLKVWRFAIRAFALQPPRLPPPAAAAHSSPTYVSRHSMPLYAAASMPPPLPPPLPRTPLFERTNKGASARGESAPVHVTSGDAYMKKLRQLANERVNSSIRQQQRYYDQYYYRPPHEWTQLAVTCVRQNPVVKAPIVPAPEESDKENLLPEAKPVKTFAPFPPEKAKRSASLKTRSSRSTPAPVARSIWPVPRRVSCDDEDPYRSIWSISPYELGLMVVEALREERLKTKESSQTTFGAPMGNAHNAANEHRVTGETSLPSLRKYYSLPHVGKTAMKALPRYAIEC